MTGRVNLIEFIEFGISEFRLGLELELKLERLEGVSKKLWGGLCILHYRYNYGINTVQNTQASPLTLPQVIPTSIPIPI